MKRFYNRLAAMTLFAAGAIAGGTSAYAVGWPANYEGVMLQGFYWDSYSDSKWTVLTSQADELSQYFKLIWVPNSAKSSGSPTMGYMPIYWFTNHNCSFGTEAQLREMISTYKEKSVGIIADCVINHRVGVSGWGDFPTEEWNGQSWHIGPEGVCCTDEWKNNGGNPTGAADTGEDFGAARDLDHTNANVQNNCKNYVKCLLEEYGYAGIRYDMVKGYAGEYTKMYNNYANVEFSVGEYWDGSYDLVKGWIDATGKTSAAFDFPCKYAINDAFSSNDMTKLVWKANGTTDQPAGMIHFGYPQYAVTFIDNHDTYENSSKFTGNVVAANAFILMSPGTPCIFLPHYKNYKQAIQQLINIRNSVGISNTSAVTVLKSTTNCYMAEITGSKGKAVVKIGSAQDSPAGYTNDDIKASGNDYCVWTKSEISGGTTPGGGGGGGGTAPDKLYMLGNIDGAQWSTASSPAMTKSGETFSITTKMTAATGETYCYFSFSDALGADWDALNMTANRYGAASEGAEVTNNSTAPVTAYLNGVDASGCKSWKILPGEYTFTVDFSNMTLYIGEYTGGGDNPGGGGGDTPDPVDMPDNFYMIGNIDGCSWSTSASPAMTKRGNTYYTTATMAAAAGETYCYFNFSDALGADWDALNMAANRYGAASEGVEIGLGQSSPVTAYLNGVDASGCKSWKILPGSYDFVVDFSTMTLKTYAPGTSGVKAIDLNSDVTPVYYNMQGIRVAVPEQGGLYIKVTGNKREKILVK
ncbi:MAG: alpha-amylase family glycosyl hydrolase [Lepagella sp.]